MGHSKASRMQLPMWNFKSQVLQAIATNQVVIVCGETGWQVFSLQKLDFANNLAAVRVHKSHRLSLRVNYPTEGIAKFIARSRVAFPLFPLLDVLAKSWVRIATT